MSNPIGALIAAFGGGVGAYDQANQRQAANDRADQEQQRRLALEDLAQQEALTRMGAHPGTGPAAAVAPSAAPPPVPAPSAADGLQSLIGSLKTPQNTGDSSAQQFAPGPQPSASPAVSALASGGAAPPASPPHYRTFNLRGLNGESSPYYIDPNDTPEAIQARHLTQAESARQSLENAKLAQQQAQRDATNKGAFTMLQQNKYLPEGTAYQAGEDYSAMEKDYLSTKAQQAASDRGDARIAGALRGGAAATLAQKVQDETAGGEAWFNGKQLNPNDPDRMRLATMYNSVLSSHPSWSAAQVKTAVQRGFNSITQGANTEARTAGTDASTGVKSATQQMMQAAQPTGAPAAAAAPAPAPPAKPAPTVDPAYRARARELMGQGLAPPAIAAQMAHEGWNNDTGQKGSP